MKQGCSKQCVLTAVVDYLMNKESYERNRDLLDQHKDRLLASGIGLRDAIGGDDEIVLVKCGDKGYLVHLDIDAGEFETGDAGVISCVSYPLYDVADIEVSAHSYSASDVEGDDLPQSMLP